MVSILSYILYNAIFIAHLPALVYHDGQAAASGGFWSNCFSYFKRDKATRATTGAPPPTVATTATAIIANLYFTFSWLTSFFVRAFREE